MHNANFGGRDHYFGRTDIHRGLAIAQLDSVLASAYMLSIVTMPLTEVVWPQFAMQVYGVQSIRPLGGWGICAGSKSVLQGTGRATLFARSVFR